MQQKSEQTVGVWMRDWWNEVDGNVARRFQEVNVGSLFQLSPVLPW
jgi:hypothetical protein